MVKHKDFGAAHAGLEEWYWQRITAAILIVLLPLPFVVLMILVLGDVDQGGLLQILNHPVARTVHSLLALSLLHHAYLGVKVIVEDYVPFTVRVPFMGLVMVAALSCGIWWLALIWGWG